MSQDCTITLYLFLVFPKISRDFKKIPPAQLSFHYRQMKVLLRGKYKSAKHLNFLFLFIYLFLDLPLFNINLFILIGG